jgi:hypothetical protein
LADQYNPLDRLSYIGNICLVAKVGLGAQCISGGPEFTNGRARSMLEAHLDPSHGTKMLGKCCTPHTKEAYERYLTSKSLISRLAGQEKWHSSFSQQV